MNSVYRRGWGWHSAVAGERVYEYTSCTAYDGPGEISFKNVDGQSTSKTSSVSMYFSEGTDGSMSPVTIYKKR